MNRYQVSKEVPIAQVKIIDEFWSERREVNAKSAIYHQWDMLEQTGTIDNFRIIAGSVDKFREGYFYVDSDSHKWAEAAATILQTKDDKKLLKILTEYLDLLISAQEEDGYISTFNQYHFPNKRWINHQIEHELYILGHLIEASIKTYQVIKSEKYLELGIKAADLLVQEFSTASPKFTPGHPEIEIALIKLYRFTKEKKYLELAKHFIKVRGKFLFFGYNIFKENLSHHKRTKEVKKQKETYFGKSVTDESLMSEWPQLGTKRQLFRFYSSAFTGKYLQQNKPVRRQKKPVGHCVRWGYLVTAATMIYQETGDETLLKSLQKSWNEMVQKKMYVTGGIGSLPLTEGFGRNYELDNKSAYNETCAAISSVFWSWEMLLSTGDAKYADLIEWQLYNAILVGMSADGKSYFYRNPLEVDELFERKEWYKTACCPSNISRTLAHLAKYIYSYDKNNIWIHQYIGNKVNLVLDDSGSQIEMEMESGLSSEGNVSINITCKQESDFALNLRIPGWSRNAEVKVNGMELNKVSIETKELTTASDIFPFNSYYLCIKEDWLEENRIELNFPMVINVHSAHKRVNRKASLAAFSRGPIVYCFEDKDNPDIDLKEMKIDLSKEIIELKKEEKIFLNLQTEDCQTIKARPYYSWGNEGKSSMRVWI